MLIHNVGDILYILKKIYEMIVNMVNSCVLNA